MASAVSATETRVSTSLKNADELSGVGFGNSAKVGVVTTPMENGDLAYLLDVDNLALPTNNKYYHLLKESNLTPDGVDVILTYEARIKTGAVSDATAGPGRWVCGPVADCPQAPTGPTGPA